MSVMKKDVNFIFFILIIATVVSFAGFTAYYQVSFRNINEEYSTKLAELNRVTKDLLEKKATLLQTSVELNTTKQGREELGEKYEDLKDERDLLKDERDTLKENLYKTRSQLASTQSQLQTVTAELANAKADIEYWKDRYNNCDDDLEACEAACPG